MLALSMATRFVLRSENDLTFTVVDIFTGQPAQFAGKTLSKLTLSLAEAGLFVVNELDELRRELWDLEERREIAASH